MAMDERAARAKPDKVRPPAPRGASVDRLLEAAEVLFGRHGIAGVSLRQIQLAAGSGNKFAVQYHFGSPAGLVQALLAKRMPAVDALQADLLTKLEAQGRLGDCRALLDIFLRPLVDQRNAAGERSYARFIAALLRDGDGAEHCRRLFHLTPTTYRILEHLQAANPHLSADVLGERMRLLSGMVFNSVYNRLDRDVAADAAALASGIDDALDMAAAALAVRPARAAK